MEAMRASRANLPVSTRASDLLQHIEENEVTICMAATGSGKTTQIPQLILDHWIDKGKGALCNVLCTQPRRIAAISVAQRVANERGQGLGESVGYQVRFDAKFPEKHGSITFCTTGIFLKRMQSALVGTSSSQMSLDDVTHIVVDEVHERDVDTDLILVALKRLLADRKAKNKPLRVILMSATIDPTLFQEYFSDSEGRPAQVVDIPGRAFPVEKHFLDDFVPALVQTQGATSVLLQEPVLKFLHNELAPEVFKKLPISHHGRTRISGYPGEMKGNRSDNLLELPYPLIALTIAHVLQTSDSGHVLVFLPGWDDILKVQTALLSGSQTFGLNFADEGKWTIHLLHSTVPVVEQQKVF
jgi:HrpA-like RNA helicase